MHILQFQVRKGRLAETRVVTIRHTPLAAGEVRIAVDTFAYTANNITYAAFGDAMHYWDFFPAAEGRGGSGRAAGEAAVTSDTAFADEAGAWGCIPVWGFGDVVESLHPGVAVGERLYGYWPMATHAVLQPGRLEPAWFSDAAPHRAGLHPVYNRYLRCAADPFYRPDTEAVQSLLRPLFLTAWLIDDFLADNAFFGTAAAASAAGSGGGVVLLSSASSKTASATAALLARRPEIEVVGLTSARNVVFCRGLGVYSRVLAYDELDALPAGTPCVYVDFAGNGGLRKAIHARFERLAYSCAVGGTHVDQLAGGGDLAGPRPVLFFAPAQAKKRTADFGAEGLQARMVTAWNDFLAIATEGPQPWIVVQRHEGPDAVAEAHRQVLHGQDDPRIGRVLSMGPQPLAQN
jgi:Protein of unknown function (DUF2855)